MENLKVLFSCRTNKPKKEENEEQEEESAEEAKQKACKQRTTK